MPIPLLLAAAPAIAQSAAGLSQMLFSGKNKARKQLEAETNKNPIYGGSKPISDYYNTALSRFQENPYQSQQYITAAKNAQRGTATGLNALQDRRSGLAGVSRMVAIQDQALENAGVNAENQRNQRFGALGQAANAKNADLLKQFQINQQNPYERRVNLANMKAQGAANVFNSGMSNLFGGISSLSSMLGSKSSSSSSESFLKKKPDLKVGKLPKAMAQYAKEKENEIILPPNEM